MQVKGLGLFERRGKAVLWAGLAPCPELLILKRAVDEALARWAGLAPEAGRFFPHITLSRLKTGAPDGLRRFINTCRAEIANRFLVTSFTLFSSKLSTNGALHSPEEAYPLQQHVIIKDLP